MFNDLSRAEALEYSRFKLSYDEVALRDLAWLLRDERSMMEQLNYSVETIDVLWRWAVRFADSDLPGIPEGAASVEQVVLEHLKGPGAVPMHRIKFDDRREYFDDILEA